MQDEGQTYEIFHKWIDELQDFWAANGRPSPQSDKYLGMNRIFFLVKGMEWASDNEIDVNEVWEKMYASKHSS